MRPCRPRRHRPRGPTPTTPRRIPPDADPGPTPTAGTASTPDGVATVDWPANAFGTAATVTLTSTTLPRKSQGFAAGSSIAQLGAQAATGTPIARFAAPFVLHFGPLAPDSCRPTRRRDHLDTSRPLHRHQPPYRHRQPLQPGQDGSIDIATLVPGSFGLLLDTTRPSRPTSRPGSATERCSCAGNPQRTTAPRSLATAHLRRQTDPHPHRHRNPRNRLPLPQQRASASSASWQPTPPPTRARPPRRSSSHPRPRPPIPVEPSRSGPGSSPHGNPRASAARTRHQHPSRPGTGPGAGDNSRTESEAELACVVHAPIRRARCLSQGRC